MTTTHKQSEIPNDLEEAAKKFSKTYRTTGERTWEDDLLLSFIAGAKWDREQMMKEAVEARVIELELGDTPHIILGLSDEFKKGDMVRVIVCKKED